MRLAAKQSVVKITFHSWNELRHRSADALVALGPVAAAAVPPLIHALSDQEAGVRENAARALGGIGAESESAIPPLVQLLGDPDAQVRSAASYALGMIGPACLPNLIKVIAGGSPDVQVEAIRTIYRVRSEAARKLPSYRKWTPRPRPVNLDELFGPGHKGAALVRTLANALQAPDARVREAAASQLGWLREGAKEALPALQTAIQDPELKVREAAYFAIAWYIASTGGVSSFSVRSAPRFSLGPSSAGSTGGTRPHYPLERPAFPNAGITVPSLRLERNEK